MQYKICPNCHTSIPQSFAYCPACGGNLYWAPGPTPKKLNRHQWLNILIAITAVFFTLGIAFAVTAIPATVAPPVTVTAPAVPTGVFTPIVPPAEVTPIIRPEVTPIIRPVIVDPFAPPVTVTPTADVIPMPSGLNYVSWDFGRGNFRTLLMNVTIYNEPNNKDGLYFGTYYGKINGTPFYFGLQTDILYTDTGKLSGKGLIFSRWGARDLSEVHTVEGGWSQSAGYEGDFVGIRKHYNWTTHSYQLKLEFIESDNIGNWYGLWITDLTDYTVDYLGSIRFPMTTPDKMGIEDGGITFTEIYNKKIPGTPLPNWHVSVDSVQGKTANGSTYSPESAYAYYSSINKADAYYDASTKKIHLIIGEKVRRIHQEGALY
jgi:hypothetical protein